jgi:hypothetical protein
MHEDRGLTGQIVSAVGLQDYHHQHIAVEFVCTLSHGKSKLQDPRSRQHHPK